jgi:GntR family transcriptional repressor for pyruvate dehydrogenase complex
MSAQAQRESAAPRSASAFEPLPENSRADEVVRRLTKSISLGLLAGGARLPPEPELADQLGVATVTLREALATLRERGLITTRRGRAGGSFVTAKAPDDDREYERALDAMSLDELRDLLDHHAAIVVATAQLAAQRAGKREVLRLQADVVTLAAGKTPAERRRADAGFHIHLAASTHSQRLTREAVRFQGEISGLLWLLPGRGPNVKALVRNRRQIVDAVAARDSDGARQAAEGQVTAMSRTLIRWHLHQRDESAQR